MDTTKVVGIVAAIVVLGGIGWAVASQMSAGDSMMKKEEGAMLEKDNGAVMEADAGVMMKKDEGAMMEKKDDGAMMAQ